jgi:hypothetical protein
MQLGLQGAHVDVFLGISRLLKMMRKSQTKRERKKKQIKRL